MKLESERDVKCRIRRFWNKGIKAIVNWEPLVQGSLYTDAISFGPEMMMTMRQNKGNYYPNLTNPIFINRGC